MAKRHQRKDGQIDGQIVLSVAIPFFTLQKHYDVVKSVRLQQFSNLIAANHKYFIR